MSDLNSSNSNISKRLIVFILLFSSVITLVLTAIQLNLNYRYDLNLIEQRFHQIEITNVNSITQKAWTVNELGLQDELASILKLPDITFIEFIPVESDREIQAFGYTDTHHISHTIPISHLYRDQDLPLGELHITASLSNVYQRLIDTALIILLTQALKTFAVSMFIFFLFRQLLTRHLQKIALFMTDRQLFKKSNILRLNRKQTKWTDNDELDTVTKAINAMVGNIRQVISTLHITQQKLIQAQDLSHTAHWEYDPINKLFQMNPQANKLLKLDQKTETITLNQYLNMLHTEDQTKFYNQIEYAQEHDQTDSFEVRVQTANAQNKMTFFQEIKKVNMGDGKVFLLGSIQDISKMAEHRQKLEFLANTDTLTSLANRNKFHTILENRLQDLQTNPNKPFAVMIADLDRFKEVNDVLGHHAGDQLLKDIGPRFIEALGPNDKVARLGGDEFAFLIEGDINSATVFVNEVFNNITAPFEISGVQISVGISIGIALAPKHSIQSYDLLRFADIAMYNAKRKRIGYQIYSNETDVHGLRRLELMTELRTAIETEQLTLYYQPKIILTKGNTSCYGHEALIRWNHPSYGLVPPDEFIPFAEMSELITPLTLWVLRQAIKDSKTIYKKKEDLITSINISSRNLHDLDFPNQIENLMHEYLAEPQKFILEITESAIMEDPQQACKSIQTLADLGFKISIDDFGTGYSSLTYLKNLPVNELKIDKTFVLEMMEDDSDYTIVKSTIDLAHNLGLTVTAEGVETAEIENALIELNCDIAQGYLYSQPLPLNEFIEWIEQAQQSKNRKLAVNDH